MNTVFQNRSWRLAAAITIAFAGWVSLARGQDQSFRGAPASAQQEKNPYAGQAEAATAGKTIFARSCAACHGPAGSGTGNVPSLANGPVQGAPDGAIFWYITKGDVDNGMPSWQSLSTEQRWQVITYIKSLKSGGTAQAELPAAAAAAKSNAPPPKPPFTDYRFEHPGTVRHITLQDLPEPPVRKLWPARQMHGPKRRLDSRSNFLPLACTIRESCGARRMATSF
jgi:mono/diheme cytochrome c family protein